MVEKNIKISISKYKIDIKIRQRNYKHNTCRLLANTCRKGNEKESSFSDRNGEMTNLLSQLDWNTLGAYRMPTSPPQPVVQGPSRVNPERLLNVLYSLARGQGSQGSVLRHPSTSWQRTAGPCALGGRAGSPHCTTVVCGALELPTPPRPWQVKKFSSKSHQHKLIHSDKVTPCPERRSEKVTDKNRRTTASPPAAAPKTPPTSNTELCCYAEFLFLWCLHADRPNATLENHLFLIPQGNLNSTASSVSLSISVTPLHQLPPLHRK